MQEQGRTTQFRQHREAQAEVHTFRQSLVTYLPECFCQGKCNMHIIKTLYRVTFILGNEIHVTVGHG